MSQEAAPINGINVPELVKVINGVAQDADKGKTKWRAKVRWQGGTKSDVYIRSFPAIRMDEPPGLTGSDTAPNMVEFTIGALGACWITGFAANASARGIKINDLEVELQGDIDLRGFFGLSDQVNPGYDAIKAKVRINADAPKEKLQELYQDVLRTSPVGHTISRPVTIESELVTQ
ncbi:MAG: OsmC family protein [Thaumarchaeota archaeon]|nr:OsmC family protein [Nitrososphaerota archaeon]